MAVFDDRVEIWSDGTLPFGIRPRDLTREHVSKPRNPDITNVFYRRGLIEQWGRGTNRIVELTLKAGHPAPEFEEIAGSVVVHFRPKSHTLTPQVTPQVAPEVAPEVTPEVRGMLSILEGEMNRSEIMTALGLRDEKHFRQHYQQTAVVAGLIEMTIPDKPQSRLQKYRLTDKGRAWLAAQKPSKPQ